MKFFAPSGSVVGLVLAAGAGRRYGRPKILVPGWLSRAVRALSDSGCDRVLVVTGAARPPIPDGAVEVHCTNWERGIGASLRAGLAAVGDDAARVVIHVVDCPDVNAAVVERVLRSPPNAPARAVFGGRTGHPVVIPVTILPEVLTALRDQNGAGPYLRARHDVRLIECGDLASGVDIDQPNSTKDAPIASTGIQNA